MSDKRKVVTTISFDSAADRELARIVDDLGAASKAEVIRHALSLYSFVERELNAGGELLIERNGVGSRVLVPGMRTYAQPRPRQDERRPRTAAAAVAAHTR